MAGSPHLLVVQAVFVASWVGCIIWAAHLPAGSPWPALAWLGAWGLCLWLAARRSREDHS